MIYTEKLQPGKPEKEVISMRISSEVPEKIDQKAAAVNISRSEFINRCIAFAPAHMGDDAQGLFSAVAYIS